MLRGTTDNVEALWITGAPALDRIEVIWINYGECQGSVTITCYGCAWTAYFGGMMTSTIQQFFAEADADYLVNKLGLTPLLKQRKADLAYLRRIVEAIKAALGKEGPPC